MRYKPKSIAALQLALGGLPSQMRVEVEPDIEISAKTVGEPRTVNGSLLKRTGANVALWFFRVLLTTSGTRRMLRSAARPSTVP